MYTLNPVGPMGLRQPIATLANYGYFGQTHHAVAATVTVEEIISELGDRGYSIEAAAPPVVHHAPPTLTKAGAIRIGTDEALDYMGTHQDVYGIVNRTTTRPRRCPYSGGCALPARTFDAIAKYGVALANYYLKQPSALPDWVAGMGASYMQGYFGYLGQDYLGQNELVPPGPSWWDEHGGLLVTVLGGAIATYGERMTAKQLAETIRQHVPQGALTKADVAELIADLSAENPQVPPATIAAGVQQGAATPSWMWPLVIGAAVLVVVTMMGSRRS